MNVEWKITDNNGVKTTDTKSLWIGFNLDQEISNRTKTYSSSAQASLSPIASKIFGFPWVEEVTVFAKQILIKRQDWVDFNIIAEPLKELISEHFSLNESSFFEENPEPEINNVKEYNPADYSKEERLIIEFLAEEVNPQVASHGGKISFIKLKNKSVYLKMEGGCQGCGMAAITLKEGVEKSLLEKFDFITTVIDTTDHSSGIKPYL